VTQIANEKKSEKNSVVSHQCRTFPDFHLAPLTLPLATMSSNAFHVALYSILMVQMGLGEPSGSRSGWGTPGGFSRTFSPNANGLVRCIDGDERLIERRHMVNQCKGTGRRRGC
jgi:hypothetical protein